jgi:hypothetical protein
MPFSARVRRIAERPDGPPNPDEVIDELLADASQGALMLSKPQSTTRTNDRPPKVSRWLIEI